MLSFRSSVEQELRAAERVSVCMHVSSLFVCFLVTQFRPLAAVQNQNGFQAGSLDQRWSAPMSLFPLK
jgi:hypothetical protein